MTNSEFIEKAGQCIGLLEELKREMKQREPHEYERWKAGGFAVDGGFVSPYPSLQQISEEMEAEAEDECPECGEPTKELIKVKTAGDDGVSSIFVCEACASTIGER